MLVLNNLHNSWIVLMVITLDSSSVFATAFLPFLTFVWAAPITMNAVFYVIVVARCEGVCIATLKKGKDYAPPLSRRP
jgi:hypothetical protein